MENIKNVLNEEELEKAAGGINIPNPNPINSDFANMPNPFAKHETVTTNPQVFSGVGHSKGETWIAMDGSTMYMVKAGDTLFQIALNHNLTLKEVEQLNGHITNFKWIHPGDVIMLKRA